MLLINDFYNKSSSFPRMNHQNNYRLNYNIPRNNNNNNNNININNNNNNNNPETINDSILAFSLQEMLND